MWGRWGGGSNLDDATFRCTCFVTIRSDLNELMLNC